MLTGAEQPKAGVAKSSWTSPSGITGYRDVSSRWCTGVSLQSRASPGCFRRGRWPWLPGKAEQLQQVVASRDAAPTIEGAGDQRLSHLHLPLRYHLLPQCICESVVACAIDD